MEVDRLGPEQVQALEPAEPSATWVPLPYDEAARLGRQEPLELVLEQRDEHQAPDPHRSELVQALKPVTDAAPEDTGCA